MRARAAETVLVGAAGVDITPSFPVRLSGYGNRRAVSEGVEHRLQAKALALANADGGNLSLLLTVDNVGVPGWMAEKVFDEIAKRKKLAREQFAVCSSHTHSAPMLAGVLSNLFGMDIPPEDWAGIEKYSAEVEEKLIAVGLEAIEKLRPGELFWGMGRAGFAKNRRTEGGPVDHEAPALAAKVDGKWAAVLVNYACHCTTTGGEFNRVGGDWAGFAQSSLEERFPGAVALVAIGCGGDANPTPRGTIQLARAYGEQLATETERVLKGDLKALKSAPMGALARFDLAFDTLPTRARWEELAKQGGAIAYHARKNLARLDRGEALPTTLPYTAQVWAFGEDMAMIFLAGEVVVDYSLRAKRTFAAHKIWVNAYANDVPCYIPSKRIWTEGGYEGAGAMVYYDRPTRLAEDTEERIFAALERIMPKAFKVAASEKPGASAARGPLSPEEALKSFRVRAGLEVDLVAREPLVIDPVAIDFAADGRLWVAEMRDYPSGIDGQFSPGGRIKVLSSLRGDGKFDHADTLVDDVPFPTGIMAWGKGALVCAAPDILYIEDTDGDGKADVRRKLYSGFATHNYQARVNGLRWGLDGWVYGAAGLFGGTIRSAITGKDFALSGRDFRIHPDNGDFEPVAGLSQQGRGRDDFGNWFGCDNGTWMWHFPLPDHYLARNPHIAYPDSRVAVARGPNANTVYPVSVTEERFNDPDHANHTTSACGIEIYRDTALGEEYYNNAFVAEPVHNLVHRLVVTPDGTTFAGKRAPGEEQSEFLASTDNWFRPAETRTGPDGALWVVDMYRAVIEHPKWISSNRLAHLDVRAGDKQGRIYRVRKSGDNTPATWQNLTKFSDAQLVETIGSRNGVLRDLAHRLLLERKPKSVEGLQKIVSEGSWAGARAQALFAKRQLGQSIPFDGLKDSSPGVRKAAIELLDSRLPHEPSFELVAVSDPDPQVRLQAALSLGQKGLHGSEVLGRLAAQNLNDPRMRYAVLSSSREYPDVVLGFLLNESKSDAPGRPEMIDGLVRSAAASTKARVRKKAFEYVLPKEGRKFELWQLEAAGALLSAPGGAGDADLGPARAEARVLASDSSALLRSRQIALEILAHPPLAAQDLDLFARLLNDASGAGDLQKAALNGLRRSADARVADLLLANWNTKSASLRAAILDELLQREAWTERLLAALENGGVGVREIGPLQRQTLTHHASKGVASRAAKLFGQDANSDRAALVASYANVAELAGNADRGLALFAANCAACHLFRGLGHVVGPDLATYHDKGVPEFLTAILHPNAVVEPRYSNYQIETKDDRSISGVLAGETATSVTVAGASGLKETLLRSQIASMRASAFSLMPEGFEGALDRQGMANLIAYLKSASPASFGAARESREKFLREAANPAIRVTFGSEDISYPSAFGRAPLYFCRQSDGKQRVEWECAPPKAGTNDLVQFAFPVGLGFLSQPAGEFALSLNGKNECVFNVSLNDLAFANADRTVRGTYRVLERNGEDSNGILFLEVARERLAPNQNVRWAVQGSAADGQRWFGIYALEKSVEPKSNLPAANADIATLAAAILNDAISANQREQLIAENAARSAELLRAMTIDLADGSEANRRIPWIWRVAIAAGRRDDAKELAKVLEASLPAENAPLREWQAVALGGGIINGLSLEGKNPAARIEEVLHGDLKTMSRYQRALEQALPMASDDAVIPGTRYDALRMIALLPFAHAQAPLDRYLTRDANGELQQGSVSGLLDVPEPAALKLLVEKFGELNESNRRLALETIARNRALKKKLQLLDLKNMPAELQSLAN